MEAIEVTTRHPLALTVKGCEVLVGYDADCWKIKVGGPRAMWSPPYDSFRQALQAAINQATETSR